MKMDLQWGQVVRKGRGVNLAASFSSASGRSERRERNHDNETKKI